MIENYSKVRISKNNISDASFQFLKNKKILTLLNKRIVGAVYARSWALDMAWVGFLMPSGRYVSHGFKIKELEEAGGYGHIKYDLENKNHKFINMMPPPVIEEVLPEPNLGNIKKELFKPFVLPPKKSRGHPMTNLFKNNYVFGQIGKKKLARGKIKEVVVCG